MAEVHPEAQVILDPKDRAAKAPPEAQVILDPKDRVNRELVDPPFRNRPGRSFQRGQG